MNNETNPLKIKKNILVFIFFIFIVAILLFIFSVNSNRKTSASSYKVLGSNKFESKQQRHFSIESRQDKIYNIGDYTVNLDRNRMLRLNVSVRCNQESFQTFVDYDILVQNAVLDSFADCRKLRMATTKKGKEKIKQDIELNINKSLHQHIVDEVFFTKFIIQ